jgi:PIN domain nuclease of toxin-antitoxin system
VLAFLLNEPAADDVERELRDPNQTAWISAINLAEVVDVMERIYARSPSATLESLMLLETGGLRVAHVDGDIGVQAGALHARHYDRNKSALSMADCVALATASVLGEPLATADPALAAVATASGTTVVPLPDTRGRRPS